MTDNDRLNLLFDLRRSRDAEALAREVIAKNPNGGAGYTYLARALIHLNKVDEAIEAAREGVRKEPLDAWAHTMLANALNCSGDPTGALPSAEEAIRLNPTYLGGREMITNIHFQLGRFEDARRQAIEGLKLDPVNESLNRWKGWAERRLDRLDEALATAEGGLKHNPNSDLLINMMGCIQWKQAEQSRGLKRLRLHRAADAALRDSVRLDPAEKTYRDNLRGNALSCRKYVGEAILLVALPFVVIPLLGLLILLGNRRIDPGYWVPLIASFLFMILCLVSLPESSAMQAAPLKRWNIPEPPMSETDRCWGWAGLWIIGTAPILAYLLALVGFWI